MSALDPGNRWRKLLGAVEADVRPILQAMFGKGSIARERAARIAPEVAILVIETSARAAFGANSMAVRPLRRSCKKLLISNASTSDAVRSLAREAWPTFLLLYELERESLTALGGSELSCVDLFPSDDMFSLEAARAAANEVMRQLPSQARRRGRPPIRWARQFVADLIAIGRREGWRVTAKSESPFNCTAGALLDLCADRARQMREGADPRNQFLPSLRISSPQKLREIISGVRRGCGNTARAN